MSSFLENRNWQLLAVLLLSFVLYVSTVRFDYAQDDAILITENIFTKQGISGIPEMLVNDTFYGFFNDKSKSKMVDGGRYRPATQISFAIEQSLWGSRPGISHLINALLYSLLCGLIYLLCIRLLSNHFDHKKTLLFAFIVALWFAVHPLHTEVVANIKGRDELFVALFGLAAIYLLFKKQFRWQHGVLAGLSALIACFSKEHAIVFVAIYPLCVWFFGTNRSDKSALWYRWIIICMMAAIFLLVRSSILGSSMGTAITELMNNPFLKFDGSKMIPFSFEEKWAGIAFNLGKYLQLFAVPYPLTSDYYPYHFGIKQFSNIEVIASIVFHLAMISAMIVGFFKQQKWAFGLLFYFGFLFLVSNVPFVIGTNISERFMFLPSLGLIFCLTYLGFKYFSKYARLLLGVFAGMCLIFSIQTIIRSQVWKDDFTLLTTDVLQSTNSAKALNGAGGALSDAGNQATDLNEKKKLLEQSNRYLNRALELYPLYQNPYLLRGNNFLYLKDFDQAIKNYNTLLDLNPNNKLAKHNLHIAYRDAGRYYGEEQGNLDKALSYLLEAHKLNERDYESIRLLGICYGVRKNHQQAIVFFKKALELNPKDYTTWRNLAHAYKETGNQAQEQYALKMMDQAKAESNK